MPIVDHLMTRVSKDIDPKEIEITQRVLKQIFFLTSIVQNKANLAFEFFFYFFSMSPFFYNFLQ